MNSKEKSLIKQALQILEDHAKYNEQFFTSADSSKEYFKLRLANLEREEFHVMLLTNKHSLIDCDCLFQGTINASSVYPREIVKYALKHNASAVVLCHNHPSGDVAPSTADIAITKRLQEALELIDVRLLDHIIVGGNNALSMAESGHI